MIDIKPFLTIGKFKTYKENETLFMQNDLGSNMYIVVKGTFGVYINTFADFPMRVAGLQEGAFFGEMTVIDDSPRSATIISEEQSSAIVIEKENFSLLIEEHPDISLSILKTLSERVKSMMEKMMVKGKAAPELPENLSEPQHISAGIDLENMAALSRVLRELNKLLSSGGSRSTIERKKNANPITLLPAWHRPLKEEEFGGWGNAMMLEQKDCVCPYCGNSFKWMVPAFLRLKEKRKTLDQRILYDRFNILLYTYIVCQNCNYSDTYHEFVKKRDSFHQGKVEGNQFINTEKFTGYSHEIRRTPEEVVLSCYLNLACLEQVPESGLCRAKAWQRLYWMYKDYGRKEEAKAAAWESIKYYRDYIFDKRDEMSVENYMTINLILGELHAYRNEIGEACHYFSLNTEIDGFTNSDIAISSRNRLNDFIQAESDKA